MATLKKQTPTPWNTKGTSMPWNQRDDSGKPFANAKRFDGGFYQSRRWNNLRKWYFTQHPTCEQCNRKGIIVKGYFVDHIQAIQDGGDPLAVDNLQTLCKACHASKTNKEIAKRR